MNESQLDALIARYGDDYHRPPDNPPLLEIRDRVYKTRPRSRNVWWPGATLLAVAAGLLLAVVVPQRDVPRVVDPRVANATEALASAVRSAEEAAQRNPRDEFYRDHLRAMVENAEYFRTLQQRQLQGIQ